MSDDDLVIDAPDPDDDCFWHPGEHVERDCPGCAYKIMDRAALIDELLDVLGHPEAYVTDQSALCDFDHDHDAAQRVAARFGIDPPARHLLLWQVVDRIGRQP